MCLVWVIILIVKAKDVVMEKAIETLLVTAIVITLSTAIISTSAAAQDSEDSYTSAPPIILVYKNENDGSPIDYYNTHPVIHTDKGNVTLWIKILMPYQVYNAKLQGTVMWLGGYLTSVSYEASWQNNQTVELYANTSNNGQGQFDFSLTNIPYGDHHLEVSASCVVFILDQYSPVSSHPFYDSTEKSVDFTVAPNPTPTPTPTPTPSQEPRQTEQEIIIGVAIAVAVIGAGLGLLIYLIKRK